MKTSIFNASEFWRKFITDIRRARGRVIIQSPFVTDRRVALLAGEFANSIKRGVTICVFVQKPQGWSADPSLLSESDARNIEALRTNVEKLRSLGVHVNLRSKIHGKLILIDDRTVWEGSLNPLSHRDMEEHMRRIDDEREMQLVIQKHRLANCRECQRNCVHNVISSHASPEFHTFGKVISFHRCAQKLSRRQLARDCGFPNGRMSVLEGGNNMTMQTMLKVCNRLGLDVLLVPRWLVPAMSNHLQRGLSDAEE